jgi:PLD-like domain
MATTKAPPFRLINRSWDAEILAACSADRGPLRIVCPFIKLAPLRRILSASRTTNIEVITRFDLNCFNQGVSDLEALKLVLDAGGRVRGVRNLHAKLYLFGSSSVIATSANVTDAAFLRNHEFGFTASHSDVLRPCQEYFSDLWKRARPDLTSARLMKWMKQLEAHRRKGGGVTYPNALPDHGAHVGDHSPLALPSEQPAPQNQAFIKFFRQGHNRLSVDTQISEIVADSGCNWACTYPSSKPPRQVEDGDLIYMARIVEGDIMIFGRALGRRHRDQQDTASLADLKARPWKAGWPRYVRVHDAQFVDAEIQDGVSFYEMMEALGSDSFDSTQRNARTGNGNTDPFASYFRKAHMLLTPRSRAWIEAQIDAALRQHGEVDLAPTRFRPPKG